ncbi:MAG: LexA family transcriptional regulator [Muribaculaceae bacterium]|nr:LexA family transcriptional regulator [Muribaculaceae bacterium]
MKTFSKKDIVNRLRQVVNAENNSDLANKLGVRKSTISNWINRDSIDYDLVFSFCEHVNLDWLLTGRGEMLKQPTQPYITSEEGTDMIASDAISTIHYPKSSERIYEHDSVSLYDIEAAANLHTILLNRDENVIGQIVIPNIPKCDGAIYVHGDSMSPLLKSGDIIAFKVVPNELSSIYYGEMYLVSMDLNGDDYLTVKYINRSEKGDEWVKLVSHNTYYAAKDVPVSAIRFLALVKFSISMHTMS